MAKFEEFDTAVKTTDGDRVQRQSYGINSKDIYGYGTPQY